jgi:hypothetical protein
MAVANTLAYYNTATITSVKSFIVQAQGLSNKSFSGVNELYPSTRSTRSTLVPWYPSSSLHIRLVFNPWGPVLYNFL